MAVLAWRNEPTTIPWMGTPEPLAREDHEPWFESRINSPDCLFFIIEVDGEPAGQIRYERKDGICKVSLNVTARVHGRGVATRAFSLGSQLVQEAGFADSVVAQVKPDNIPCLRALQRAGYAPTGNVLLHGREHISLVHDLRTPD